MQLVNRIIISLILIPLLIVVLMPKKEIYYLIEKKLAKQHIVISSEELDSGLFGLNIKHPKIYYMGSQVATAKEIKMWTALVYTAIDAKMLSVAQGLPQEMIFQNIKASHSIISPKKIKIAGVGTIGNIKAQVDLAKRKVIVTADKAGVNPNISRHMKKIKGGWKYESRF